MAATRQPPPHSANPFLSGRERLGAAARILAPHWGAALALALFLAAGLAALDDYGVTSDQVDSALRGERHYAFLIGEDDDFSSAEFYVRLYGPTFDLALLFVERAFRLEASRGIHLSQHLLVHLCFLAGGLFAYLLACRALGNRLLGLLAMALFLLHPRLYAHSFFNGRDIPFLFAFAAALYLTHRAFRRDTLSAFILLGAAVGALVNLRIMGLALLAAVPAMRALDFALASGWAERKRVLVTTGGFALASALAIYALLPYLWGDPIGRAVEWWTTLSDHPYKAGELFRGTAYGGADFPAEYLPVWFLITSPPFALALGFAGTAFVLVAAARSVRRALRNGRLRFALLLAGCFAAPVPIVILLDANAYQEWRHLYFLWAPFALLAAFGLQGLANALRRAPRGTAAVYGAACVGLAATAISMTLLHPYQQVSFNFFVDRMAPEHLRAQYRLENWNAGRHALEWISRSELPIGEYRFEDKFPGAAILPEGVLDGLSRSLSPDALVVRFGSAAQPARALHRMSAYGSTLATVERKDALRAVYEEARRREPILVGVFDAYLMDGALALIKEPCAPSFLTKTVFRLRGTPVDGGDPAEWRQSKGFEVWYDDLADRGALFEGKCITSVPLPDYPIAEFELRWSPELLADGEAGEKARRARDAGRLLERAAHRSAYDVYLADGELAYLNNSCDPIETEHSFHLNVYPERAGDLPEHRREHGFERFHFEFWMQGAFADGGCGAFFPLPDYPVAAIQTGQRGAEGSDLWFAEFLIDPERRWADIASGASGDPIARSDFDVHLTDGALVYVKEPCEPADTEARFFLHVTPERISDLRADRRIYGFDNLDFDFFPNGALFEGRCAVRAALPEYPIASIRAGQYAGGIGEIWSAEFAIKR